MLDKAKLDFEDKAVRPIGREIDKGWIGEGFAEKVRELRGMKAALPKETPVGIGLYCRVCRALRCVPVGTYPRPCGRCGHPLYPSPGG